jgi:hypothetical protein
VVEAISSGRIRDANHCVSPASAGDGNFNPGLDLSAGDGGVSQSAGG